jgi:lipopolysaccharide export system protein LptA
VRNTVRRGQRASQGARQTLSLSGDWFTLSGAPPSKLIKAGEVIELSADWLTLQLPPTNGPVRRIEAERNVVIASSADNSRATAGMAVYDEAIGTFELTENPILAGRDYLVKGAKLVLNRTNRVFSARRNAYMRIPVAALGKTSLLPRDPVLQRGAGTATNRFIEVYSDDFDYRTNQMNFFGNVRGDLVAGDLKQGDLQCADLQITFGDRLEKLFARGGVRVRQFPTILSDGKRVSKELVCETLTVTMDSEGRLTDILAEQEVMAQQLTTRTNTPNPSLTKVSMNWLKAKFFPQTNQVESIIAERNVRIEQEGRTAQGNHAVFDGASQVLELTGQPTAMSPEGRITQTDVLVWDAAKQLCASGDRSNQSGSASVQTGRMTPQGPGSFRSA